MKSSPGIPLHRGDNLFVKGPNDPKTLPKRQKRSRGAKFDGNYTKYGYYQLTVVWSDVNPLNLRMTFLV